LRQLAAVGALNDYTLTRRRAIWAVEEPELEQGDLFADPAKAGSHQEREEMDCPLPNMSYVERVQADFSGLGLTTGKHPMCLVRPRLPVDVLPAGQLSSLPL
jgi:error-prone DNA polymerase